MVIFTNGDMFSHEAAYRINTVNCVGVMGAGVALAFKQRYPEMFDEYRRKCAEGEIRIGELHVWEGSDCTVINLPTKKNYRKKSQYEWIESGLIALRRYFEDKDPVKVTLPALGCGHGGLDWDLVQPKISEYLKDLEATFIVFTPDDSRNIGKQGD